MGIFLIVGKQYVNSGEFEARTKIRPGQRGWHLEETNLDFSGQDSSRSLFFLFVLFTTAIVIQALFLYVALPSRYHVNDNENYWEFYKPVAENILLGNGLVGSDGKLSLVYPPGYPAVIAATFAVADRTNLSRDRVLEAFDIVLAALSSLLIFLTANDLFGGRIALLTWFLWVSYIPNLWSVLRPNSETPFMLLLYGAIWGLVRTMRKSSPGSGFLVGVILGLAALIRPIGLFLPFVLGAIVLSCGDLVKKKRFLIAALILTGFVISVAPWETYVVSRTGKLVLLSTNGASSMFDGLVFALDRGPNGEQARAPGEVISLMERAKTRQSELSSISSVLKFSLQEATEHTRALAEFLLLKLFRPWFGMATHRHEAVILLVQLFYLPLGITGLLWGRSKYKNVAFSINVFIGVVTYFWAMAFFVLPILRYMVPPFAYIILGTAIALHDLAPGMVGLRNYRSVHRTTS